MTLTMRTLRRRLGFTLTEVAIVMSLMGVVTGAIWVAAGKARENQHVNSGYEELQAILQNADTLLTGQSFFSGMATDQNITAQVLAAQIIPSMYIDPVSGTEITSPWGVMIFWHVTGNRFRLSFYGVPEDACINLFLKATACTVGQAACPLKIWTAGASATLPAGALNDVTSAGWGNITNLSALAALCNANVGSVNSVELDYSL